MDVKTRKEKWRLVMGSLIFAMIMLSSIVGKNMSRGAIAPGGGGCQGATVLDTAQQYSVALQGGQSSAPCEAYKCGQGFEWYGTAELPAGHWRAKIQASHPVCVALLSACDSVCQELTIPARDVIDWKSDAQRRWWIVATAGQPIHLTLEVGRYELGVECITPTYWGPPCGGR